jgi:hypothetical protein
MYIYLLKRTDPVGYDEYDSCVVVADSEEQARFINPCEHYVWSDEQQKYGFKYADGRIEYHKYADPYNIWPHPATLKVKYIGEADSKLKAGAVICSSFNAG